MTSPAEHAATVRECIAMHPGWKQADESLDALVALAARADELERDAGSVTMSGLVTRLMQRAEAAEARADELDRDYERQREYADVEYRKARAAEARAERAEAALREIEAACGYPVMVRQIVRAALGEQPQETTRAEKRDSLDEWITEAYRKSKTGRIYVCKCDHCRDTKVVSGMGETVPCPKCAVQP